MQTLMQQQAAVKLERRRRQIQKRNRQTPAQRKNQQTPKQLDLLSWNIRHRFYIKRNRLFDLRRHPYLVGLYEETARQVVVYKASQVGASEYLISYTLHACDQRQANVLYVFPTTEHVSDFSSARFGPAIEASLYLDSLVVSGQGKDGRGVDKVKQKRIRDNFLYLRGGQVKKNGQAPQLKSIDADVVIFDEWDEMDPRAPIIGCKRHGHSDIAEERAVSTPTYNGRGIHAEWLRTDMREWFIRCESCNEWQFLTIDHIVIEWDKLRRPVSWHGEPGEAWAACQRCGKRLNHLAPGQWVPTWPEREAVGFHLTKLFSHQANLLQIVENLQTTDETKRREAYNQDLGEPYTPSGGQLTDEVLDACRRDYGHGPIPDETTIMGVDVGKVLHGVIRGEVDPLTGERPQRWAGEMVDFAELGQMMKRFKVRVMVIDSKPEAHKVCEFQEACDFAQVWLADYPNIKEQNYPDIDNWDEAIGLVRISRTRSLDQTFSGFYDGLTTPPGNAPDIRDYYDHLKAPVRILEHRPNGQPVARYVEDGPDHLAHAENYCRAAANAPTPPLPASSSRSVSVQELGV